MSQENQNKTSLYTKIALLIVLVIAFFGTAYAYTTYNLLSIEEKQKVNEIEQKILEHQSEILRHEAEIETLENEKIDIMDGKKKQ